MKLYFLKYLASAYLLLISSAIADTALDGNVVGDPFCLENGQGGERRGAITGSCSPLEGIVGVLNQRKNCYWAANVWVYQHELQEVFTQSSTNTCGHCTTNFTCMAKTSHGGILGTDDEDVYENAQITAADIYNGLQSALAKCSPADGNCAIEWLNEDCLVQTYFAEQLGPTNCPDAPCPSGDTTCEVLDPNTCGDDCVTSD